MALKDKFKEFQNLNVNDYITLRQVKPEHDLQDYFEIYSDEKVFSQYGGSGIWSEPNPAQVLKILQNQINAFEKQREYVWTITENKTDKALGRIHLSNFESNNRIANIGYFLRRDLWGKGITSSCITPVVRFGIEYLNLERIYTKVLTTNIGSWKALEKNGFIREGTLRHCFEYGTELNDCYIYSILSID